MNSCFKTFLPLLFIVATLAGCTDFKRLSDRSKLILKTKKEFFRGLDFDIGINEVKRMEREKLTKEYNDYLHYTIDADSVGKGESIDLEYFFNKSDQLDLIIAFYNLPNTQDIKPLILDLKKYFEHKYGPAMQDESGWYNWEFDDRSGIAGTIEINLVGETEEGYRGVEIEMLKYYESEERLK